MRCLICGSDMEVGQALCRTPWRHISFARHGAAEAEVAALRARAEAAEARLARAESALRELADLMDAVRDGSYTPDSFTTQPARAALAEWREGDKP